MTDINKPDYYASGEIETKDFIRDKELNFFLGNVVKYVVRAGKKDKDKLVEDLEKARNYLDFEIEHIKKQERIKKIASKSSVKRFNCDCTVRPVEKKSMFKGIKSFVGIERPIIKPDNLQDILFGGNNAINLADLVYEKINVSTKFQEGDKIVYKPSLDGECVYTYEKYEYAYKTSYNVHEIGAVVEVSDNTGGTYIVPSEKLINQEYYIKKGV